jgi:hypothetical protein
MNDSLNTTAPSFEKLNLETALIPWQQLQRFFASGQTVFVSSKLDLIQVANAFAKDDKALVEPWLHQDLISKVSDQQAIDWIESNTEVWSVVIKPWVLVQNRV